MPEAENRIPQEEISKELPKSTSPETTGREIPTGSSAENLDKQGNGGSVEALNQAIDRARAAGFLENKNTSGGEKSGETEALTRIMELAVEAGKPKIFNEFGPALEKAGLDVGKARYEAISNAIVNGNDEEAFDCLFHPKYFPKGGKLEGSTFSKLLSLIESTGNIKYLSGEGDDDLAYAKQLEGPARNIALRDSIKLELTDEDSQFSKTSSRSIGMIKSWVLARMLAMEGSKLAELVRGELLSNIDSEMMSLDQSESAIRQEMFDTERFISSGRAADPEGERKKYNQGFSQIDLIRQRRDNLKKIFSVL